MNDMKLAEEIGKACTEARADMFVSWLLERLIQDQFTRPKVKQDATTALAALRRGPEPVPMLMFCPRCSKQHIDAPKGEWTNPPHATHTCQFCGLLWRPSNESTTGVKEIQQLESKHAERIAASFPSERPPSGEMVMVPREPTGDMRLAGCNAIQNHYMRDGGWCGLAAAQEQMILTWDAMLSACEEKK